MKEVARLKHHARRLGFVMWKLLSDPSFFPAETFCCCIDVPEHPGSTLGFLQPHLSVRGPVRVGILCMVLSTLPTLHLVYFRSSVGCFTTYREPSIDYMGQQVDRATLGIIGMGSIGYKIAQRARAFEMKIVYHNRNVGKIQKMDLKLIEQNLHHHCLQYGFDILFLHFLFSSLILFQKQGR